MIFICLKVPAYKYSFIILLTFYHIKSIPLLILNSLTVTNSMLSVISIYELENWQEIMLSK